LLLEHRRVLQMMGRAQGSEGIRRRQFESVQVDCQIPPADRNRL